MSEKKITNEQIYDLLIKMDQRLDRVEKKLEKLDTIEEHVARIDERLTQTEKVKNIFRPEVLEKIES